MNSELNPKIKEITVGIETLKKIKVYPLPFSVQMELSEAITLAVTTMFETPNTAIHLSVVIGLATNLIQKHLPTLTDFAIKDGGREILKDMDNDQATEFIMLLYQQNYEGIIKKILENKDKILEKLGVTMKQPMMQAKSKKS